ncbi:glycosyltransferase family 2 protein [Hymenobacter daeguensis]
MQSVITHILLACWYVAQAYALAACLYIATSLAAFLLFYPRIRRLFQPRPAESRPAAATHFTLLVPAHNEERLLPQLLASIRRLHYPPALVEVVVIADNCTDKTATIVAAEGFACLERFTHEPSDKMQALRFGARQVLSHSTVADTVVCIIDADCVLAPGFLAALDGVYARRRAAPVVQAFRSVSNAFASNITVLDAAAEALRQWVLAGPRKLLGLDNLIFGLGCSMRRAVFLELMALPIVSLAEDKEWKVFLTQRNVRIDYCPTARLGYEVVAETPDFGQQRARWLAGYYHLLRTHGLPVLLQGLRQASPARLDLACDLLQPPRSVLFLAAVAYAVLAYCFPRQSLVSAGVWLAIVGMFAMYGAIGLRLIGAPARSYLLLFSSLRLIILVTKSTLAVVLGRGVHAWAPTRKAAPQPTAKAP